MRFLLSPTHEGEQVALDAERSHYLCKVLRKRQGEEIACFDGQGGTFTARVVQAHAKHATLEILATEATATALKPAVHLGLSILKGQAMDRALQQATELGASEITLLNAKRCNVNLKSDRADNKLQHWRKIVAGACEQCGQLFLPKVNPPMNVAEFVDLRTDTCIVLDQNAPTLPSTLHADKLSVLIGPEGGWDPSETGLFDDHQLTRYCVAPLTLRAETTPAVALAVINHAYNSVAAG